jgi:hypothetical protein
MEIVYKKDEGSDKHKTAASGNPDKRAREEF